MALMVEEQAMTMEKKTRSSMKNDRLQRLVNFDLRRNTPRHAITLYLLTFLVLLFGHEYVTGDGTNSTGGSLPILYQVIYAALIVAPHLFWCLPLLLCFIGTFPPTSRRDILFWLPVRLEILLLVLLVLTIPIVVIFGVTDRLNVEDGVKAQEVTIKVACFLAVLIQLISFLMLNDKRQLFSFLSLGRHQPSTHHQPSTVGSCSTDESESSPDDGVYPVKSILKLVRASNDLTTDEITEAENDARDIATSFCSHCNMPHTTLLCHHSFTKVSQLKGAQKAGVAERQHSLCLTGSDIFDEGSSTSSDGRNCDNGESPTSISALVQEQLQTSSISGDSPKQAAKILQNFLMKFPKLALSFLVFTLLLTVAIALLPYTQALVIEAVAFTFMELDDIEFEKASIARQILLPSTVLLMNYLILPFFDAASLLSCSKLAANVEQYLKDSICKTHLGLTAANSSIDTQSLTEGDLISRFGADVSTISGFIDGTIKWDLFPGLVNLVVSVVILGMFDLRIAIFFALCIPVMIITQSNHIATSNKSQKGSSDPNATQQGRFLNLVKIRRTNDLYDCGEFLWGKVSLEMDKDHRRLSDERTSRAWFVASVGAYANAYTAIIIFAFLLSLIDMLERGDEKVILAASLGISIIGSVYSPISRLSRAGPSWFRCAPALLRVQQVFASTHDSKDLKYGDNEGDNTPLFSNSLELKDIRFQYPGSETETLKGINQTFGIGEYVCICGESGAGKSTFLNILTREALETGGYILVDGMPVPDDKSYRKQLGVVLQDSTFFLGSVRDNILMGKPDASEDEIQQAVERAQCSEFIQSLPAGIETMLGGEVLNVSGGQAQRIGLARALVRSPRILFLDEATSALDATTEREVIETITRLAHEDKVLVVSVTHRLDTTDHSDKILLLKDGIVLEQGSPAELNMNGTHFSNLRKGRLYYP